MSKYRCPICGAAHKEQVNNCRLCGQNMSPNAIPAYQQDVKQEVHTDKSIKGVAFIGLGLVAAIIIGAVALGFIRADRQLGRAQDFVTGARHDGWAVTTSDAGKFTVELPGTVTQGTIEGVGITNSGSLAGASTYVPLKSNAETYLVVGSGAVTLPANTTGTAMSGPGVQNYIRDTILPKWLATNGIQLLEVEVGETYIAGYPAITLKTLKNNTKMGDRDAYAQVALVLKGSTLYMIETKSIFKDADQQDKMLSTFVING